MFPHPVHANIPNGISKFRLFMALPLHLMGSARPGGSAGA